MKKIVLSTVAFSTLMLAGGDIVPTEGTASWSDKFAKSVPVFSHASKLKFDGQTFLGYKYTNFDADGIDNYSSFQIRRGYFQLKAYLMEDPKSYYRVTFDVKQKKDTFDGDSVAVRAKYAYVYLNAILPSTGVEVGLAHRPWHDYEEHNSWMYRSISEILIENHNSAHLSSSADLGVMTKTRTQYFDADIGIFNGEGYHTLQVKDGMSFEWRLTGHLLGTAGHPDKNTYLDASFFGQINKKHYLLDDGNTEDLEFYGVHAVYNQPAFLVSAQYVTSTDTSDTATPSKGSGDGYSVNAEIRLGDDHQYKAFAKYDNWTPDVIAGATEYTRKTEIFGVAWKQNKNLEWVANATINDNDDDHYNGSASTANGTSYMLTAQIDF